MSRKTCGNADRNESDLLEQMRDIVAWVIDDSSLPPDRPHGNAEWTPLLLATTALVWAWQSLGTLTSRFEEARTITTRLYPEQTVPVTYQSFVKALAVDSARCPGLLGPNNQPLVCQCLRPLTNSQYRNISHGRRQCVVIPPRAGTALTTITSSHFSTQPASSKPWHDGSSVYATVHAFKAVPSKCQVPGLSPNNQPLAYHRLRPLTPLPTRQHLSRPKAVLV